MVLSNDYASLEVGFAFLVDMTLIVRKSHVGI